MKKLKMLIIAAVILTLMFALTACDIDLGQLVDEAIDNMEDYEYSEDGKQETITYYSNLELEDFEGVISYIFKTDEETLNISYYIERDDETTNTLMIYDYGQDEEYAILKLAEDSYFIDYNEKTVSDNFNDLANAFSIGLILAQYGEVEFEEDGEPIWEFVEKREATVKSYEDKDIDTVEFEYISIPEDENDEDSTTMHINFNKKLPVIMRVKYEIYEAESETTSSYIVYIEEIDPEGIEEDTFVLPTEEDGYTLKITEETEQTE